MNSKIDSYYNFHDKDKIHQGDLYQNIGYNLLINTDKKNIKMMKIKFPFAVVISQECDLDRDYINRSSATINDDNSNDISHDKFLPTILFCPGYNSEQVKEGSHLKELELNMAKYSGSKWEDIKKNQNSRYHYIPKEIKYQIPDLIFDFKHYFTLSREEAYMLLNNNYLCSLNLLIRESLSQRFAHYLSRIGIQPIKNIIQCEINNE